MKKQQIDLFFRVLAGELNEPAVVILTGAATGSLLGNVRPSLDVDFAIELKKPRAGSWEKVEEAVSRTIKLTSIQANFAEDIDRWGMISLMDYRKHTLPYRRFGKMEVKLLDPAYWSIGKLNRYIAPDIADLVDVFKRKRVPIKRLMSIWARALRSSPPSADLSLFRKHVDDFLHKHGRVLWGSSFDARAAMEHFHRATGMTPPSPRTT